MKIDGLNRYVYVRSNPLRFVDPSGYCSAEGMSQDGFGNLTGSTTIENSHFENINFSNSLLPNGNKYKIVEYGGVYIVAEYSGTVIVRKWMLAGQVGTKVIGGNGDAIYVLLDENGSYSLPMKRDTVYDTLGISSLISDVSNFMYFDSTTSSFISSQDWRDNIHYAERMELNLDGSLPMNPQLAEEAGFEDLEWYESIYHDSLGGNLKYVHIDGREAIYEPNYEFVNRTKRISGYSRVLLKDDPENGPTYNYVVPEESSAGHYLFDMLPYFWWGSIPK